MTLGLYVLHTAHDDPETTLGTVAAALVDVGQRGQVRVVCNGKGERYFPHIKDVATIRHFVPATDAAVMTRALMDYPSDVNILIKSGVMVEPGLVSLMLDALKDETVGIAAPVLYREDDTVIFDEGLSDVRFVRDWCWGWRKELIEVIGYVDWVGQAYVACPGSDVDYCYRAKQAGYRVVQVNEARARLPDVIDDRWSHKAHEWLVRKHGVLKINEVW